MNIAAQRDAFVPDISSRILMDVESVCVCVGGRRDASLAVEKLSEDVSPRDDDISVFFIDTYDNFAFSNIFKIKWPKSEEKLNFVGGWAWVPMNPSPQTKLRGDALDENPAHGGQLVIDATVQGISFTEEFYGSVDHHQAHNFTTTDTGNVSCRGIRIRITNIQTLLLHIFVWRICNTQYIALARTFACNTV